MPYFWKHPSTCHFKGSFAFQTFSLQKGVQVSRKLGVLWWKPLRVTLNNLPSSCFVVHIYSLVNSLGDSVLSETNTTPLGYINTNAACEHFQMTRIHVRSAEDFTNCSRRGSARVAKRWCWWWRWHWFFGMQGKMGMANDLIMRNWISFARSTKTPNT